MNTTINTASNLSRITLKSFKTVKWMSEETTCFTAIVLLDGKVIGEASNEGHGGSTFLHFVSPLSKATAEEFAKSISPADVKGWEFLADKGFDFADLVDIIVGKEDEKKETARIVAKVRREAIKKAHYLKTTTQKGFVSCFKGVTDLNRDKAVAQAKANPEFKTMVADMTDAEIAAWFIA
jgi:hypothetical protein